MCPTFLREHNRNHSVGLCISHNSIEAFTQPCVPGPPLRTYFLRGQFRMLAEAAAVEAPNVASLYCFMPRRAQQSQKCSGASQHCPHPCASVTFEIVKSFHFLASIDKEIRKATTLSDSMREVHFVAIDEPYWSASYQLTSGLFSPGEKIVVGETIVNQRRMIGAH